MAHRTLKNSYSSLITRLNKFPQGVAPSKTLYQILSMLFSEKEAELVSLLPIRPFNVEKASRVWKLNVSETQKILDQLADKALLVDIEQKGEQLYVLPPPMAGFFEFSLMRLRTDINQKVLSELFYQYMNTEEDFIKQLFTEGDTQLGRTFVHEPVLSHDNAIHVLDYERASEVIESASHMAVGLCYCRHKMSHLDKACDAPLDICMTFNNTAASLAKHGYARKVDKKEGYALLQKAYAHKLVQFGENVRQNVAFICNCCGCCCEAMIAARRFAIYNPIHTTNFIPEVNTTTCTGCGKCILVCPVEALSLISANNGNNPGRNIVRLNEEMCLGCGLCVRECPSESISLRSREQKVITPVNGAHRVVVMAIERGKLQNLIFDNHVLWHHRALAATLGVILKLPGIQQTLASKQLKSRYLEKIITHFS